MMELSIFFGTFRNATFWMERFPDEFFWELEFSAPISFDWDALIQ